MRRNWTWTQLQVNRLDRVLEVLEEQKDYKPLTLRQVYYQLVGKGYIENKKSEYVGLSKLVKHARLSGLISWDDIEDRGRTLNTFYSWGDADEFYEDEKEGFLSGYRRDILQTQTKYVEIWIEKDALSRVFTIEAEKYQIPVVVCKGFSSVTFLNDFRRRLNREEDQERVMLYFGDFDPSGLEMLDAMQTTLEEEMEVFDLEYKRIALNKDDIFNYNLPADPDALKETDTRAKKFKEKHGTFAVELDALPPAILVEKIREAIETELDMDELKEQRRIEKTELDKLNIARRKLDELFNNGLMDE